MYNAIWVELCRVLPIWYSLQDHNWRYSLSYLGLELSFQNWPLFEPLGCFAVFFCLGFLVVSLPAASFPPVLFICIDLKGLQAKLRHVLGYSLVTFQVTLCCWFPWELVSSLWSALECLIYVLVSNQYPWLQSLFLPGGQESLCAWPTSCLQGVPWGQAGALDHAARPWGSVLRTWTQPSLWVCLLVAANYNCKFALKIKFCLKSNFCLGAPL